MSEQQDQATDWQLLADIRRSEEAPPVAPARRWWLIAAALVAFCATIAIGLTLGAAGIVFELAGLLMVAIVAALFWLLVWTTVRIVENVRRP